MINPEELKKYQEELKTLKDTLAKYSDLFNADGTISLEEQKYLADMQGIIKKIETKLSESTAGNVANENIKGREQFLKDIEAFKNRVKKIQAEFEKINLTK